MSGVVVPRVGSRCRGRGNVVCVSNLGSGLGVVVTSKSSSQVWQCTPPNLWRMPWSIINLIVEIILKHHTIMVVNFLQQQNIIIIYMTKALKFSISIILVALLLQTTATQFVSQLDSSVAWIRKEVVDRSLKGFWKLSDDTNFRINSKVTMINEQSDRKKRVSSMLNFFAATEGLRQAQAFFQAPQKGKEATGLYIKLYDGKYNENATVIVQIDLQSTMEKGVQNDGKYILWSNTKPRFVTCLLLREREIIGRFSVGMTLEITTNVKQNQLIESTSKIDIKFQSTTFSFRAFLSPVANEYNTFVQLVGTCTFLFAVAVVFFKAKKSVYNLSEWMIVQVAAFVVSTNIIFLGEAFKKLDTNLRIVAICALINITLSLFFLRKYESVIFNEFNNKKKIILLLIFLSVYFGLVYVFKRNLVFWIYEGFILLAMQINYAYSLGGKGGMAITLVLTIIFTRVPFIYYRYYFEALSRQPNNVKMLIVFIGISIILLGFITLQRYFGSRFIIPNELIPDYFNYYKKIEKSNKKLEQTCSICTIPFKENPDLNEPQHQEHDEQEQEESDVSVEQQSNKNQRDIAAQGSLEKDNFVVLMITPCQHEFHPSCLQDWMDKRLNCPMCRTELPPSEQQRDDSYCC